MWKICLGISLALMVGSILLFIYNKKHRVVSKSISVLMAGFIMSAFVLIFPIQQQTYRDSNMNILISVLTSLQKSVRIFAGGVDFSVVNGAVAHLDANIKAGYQMVGLILTTVCPLLTLGAVLSFFKNAMAFQKYVVRYFSDAYIFSEINEKTIELAASIRESDKKCMLIFTDMFDGKDDKRARLQERAYDLGAICFRKNINDVNFQFHSKKSRLYFMLMGDDETKNIVQTLKLIDRYQEFYNARIYVLAKTAEAELMLKSKDMGKIKMVRRIKDSESLIFRNLYETGHEIFEHVRACGQEKVISALVLGMGEYGAEMAKALPWFCQMNGYRFKMCVVDKNRDAASKFEMQCPDILSPKYNGVIVDGEPNYDVKIYSGVDVNTNEFKKILENMDVPTYIFVSLGSDAQNVKTALDIRSFYGDFDFQPRLQAVLYKDIADEAVRYTKRNDPRNKQWNVPEIDFIGDLKTSYSKDTVLNSKVEQEALKRHMMWGSDEQSFWSSEYNYRSSIASVIHQKMKIFCGIPYVEEVPEKRPAKEREDLRKLEHCRWSAYVRSEGYTLGKRRNDLAKKHPCLIPYDELSPEEKAKDDV